MIEELSNVVNHTKVNCISIVKEQTLRESNLKKMTPFIMATETIKCLRNKSNRHFSEDSMRKSINIMDAY